MSKKKKGELTEEQAQARMFQLAEAHYALSVAIGSMQKQQEDIRAERMELLLKYSGLKLLKWKDHVKYYGMA